jgi:multidrug efflux pump subunit AcrA (membrane-fusion protein)
MLVQVTFLAPELPHGQSEESRQSKRLLVPRQLVDESPEGTFVWVADPAATARRQRITLGSAGTDELIEVIEGLKVTDRLISGGREGLRDGLRIRITGEDPKLGIADRT